TAPRRGPRTRAGTTRRAAPAAPRSGPEQRVADDLAKLVGESLARTFAAHATHLEQVEVVGDLDGLGDVLVDEQDRHAGSPDLAESLADRLADARGHASPSSNRLGAVTSSLATESILASPPDSTVARSRRFSPRRGKAV